MQFSESGEIFALMIRQIGELLMSVPLESMLMDSWVLEQHPQLAQVLEETGLSPTNAMAVCLLFEKARKGQSRWAEYISEQPLFSSLSFSDGDRYSPRHLHHVAVLHVRADGRPAELGAGGEHQSAPGSHRAQPRQVPRDHLCGASCVQIRTDNK